MARIRRANTKPELVIRRLLHNLGYRFRVQFGEVPGRPDIAFPARRRCVQVHGCFWHAHGCSLSRTPSTRTEFWEAKFAVSVAWRPQIMLLVRSTDLPAASNSRA